ncbi:MAG: hypothetical protein AAFV96_08550, partial [Pseudomonadota bacterium]
MPTRAATVFAIAAGVGVLGASVLGAHAGIVLFERQASARLSAALAPEDAWLNLQANGTRVTAMGEAPSRAARRAALARLGAARNGLSIIDETAVAAVTDTPEETAPESIVAEDAALKILVDGDTRVLMGNVPEADLTAATPAETVTDLRLPILGTAAEDWDVSVGYAEAIAEIVGAGEVEAWPQRIRLSADAPSLGAKYETLATLFAERPEGVALIASLNAPRPVLSPFPFAAAHDGEALSVEICAAEILERLKCRPTMTRTRS